MAVPSVTLLNGNKMPVFGLGCMAWMKDPLETERAIEEAVDIGYRSFDTAYAYRNEKQVGNALNKKIKEGKVKRSDLFVTTKLWMTYMRPENVEKCLDESLNELGMDYVDLYLVHGPIAAKKIEGQLIPMDAEGKLICDLECDPLDTWKVKRKTGMEGVYKKGKAKAIGLSNFNSKQIKRIFDNSEVKPMNLQVECHAYFPQFELQDFCKKLGVTFTAWSPLGAPWRAAGDGSPFDNPDVPKLFENPTVKSIAAKHNKTPAQIFDFSLDASEMKSMANLGVNKRSVNETMGISEDHPHYPFKEPF